jgi:hypothetical protein
VASADPPSSAIPQYGELSGKVHSGSTMRRTRRTSIHRSSYQYLLTRLRKARLESGFTQVEVARKLGRPNSYVSKCELGERRIDPIDLQEFAALYGKSFRYFLPPDASPRA